MLRYALVVIAVAAAAAIALVAVPRNGTPPESTNAPNAVQEAAAAAALAHAQEEIAALHAELSAVRIEKLQLEDELSEMQAAFAQSPPTEMDLSDPWETPFDLDALPFEAQAAAADPDMSPVNAEIQARREEWREQREDAAMIMQERMLDFLAQQYDRAGDLATQQRMSDLGANMNAMFDLRQQMRDAETDEERDALRQQMRDVWASSQNIVSEQRQIALEAAAERLGLTTPEQRRAYAASVREVMEDPFMRGGAMMGGGFGGPGMGGGRRSPRREGE